ncbi:WxcM-like domain-containing protein [Mongoliitalea daihaiensis]|uniref:WxcM-like domain-containing protein n=1 Tax=Mongoliitalea daihaiensis TaxID=2782006 RepID=UPI001F3463CD|nr:WxcM-like domain-containing protein [Mongoliitalea daihaiensis]UJP64465.1 WxcM-like domain-containing protein [Mongoliitalea daihaiensis]
MSVIEGNLHRDERGVVRFVNDFDMSRVVRMYCIEPNLGVVRAWQGHKKETKWFFAAKGSFFVKTVEMDSLEKKEYLLKDTESKVLEIPGGHYNGFEGLEEGSVLMIFSDVGLEESKVDDFRQSLENINW